MLNGFRSKKDSPPSPDENVLLGGAYVRLREAGWCGGGGGGGGGVGGLYTVL